MGEIKIINIYIAIAEDLNTANFEMELEFSDLVSQLNKSLIKRGVVLNAVKHNRNMGSLDSCELCLAIYWTKFGDYTQEQFEAAYDQLRNGNFPHKIYVFFKDNTDNIGELDDFKAKFKTDYGHFYCKFENVDTMRYHFISQFEKYQNELIGDIFTVKDKKIRIDGRGIIDLDKLSFAALNKDYNQFSNEIIRLDDEIADCRRKLAVSATKEIMEKLLNAINVRHAKESEFQEFQEFLFNTSRRCAKLREHNENQQFLTAIEMFNSGDVYGANEILNSENIGKVRDEILFDLKQSVVLMEMVVNRAICLIDIYLLKIDILRSIPQKIDIYKPKKDEVLIIKKIEEVYDEAIEVVATYVSEVSRVGSNDKITDKQLDLLFSYARYLGYDDKALSIYKKMKTILREKPSKMAANVYMGLGDIYKRLEQYNESLDAYIKSLAIREYISDINSQEVIDMLINMSDEFGFIKQIINKEKHLLKALDISLNLYGEYSLQTANIYMYLSYAYRYYDYDCDLGQKLGIRNWIDFDLIGFGYEVRSYKTYIAITDQNRVEFAEKHRDLAQVYRNEYSDHTRDIDKAILYYKIAIKEFTRLLGAAHIETIKTKKYLAKLYSDIGEYELALTTRGEIYKDYVYIYGEDNIECITYLEGFVYELIDNMKYNDDYTDVLNYSFKLLELTRKMENGELSKKNLNRKEINKYGSLSQRYLLISNIYRRMEPRDDINVARYDKKYIGCSDMSPNKKKCEIESVNKKIVIICDNLSQKYECSGWECYRNKEYNRALECYAKIINLEEYYHLINKQQLYHIFVHIGHIYFMLGDFNEALVYYVKSINYVESYLKTSKLFFDISNVYISLEDYNNAIRYLHMAMDVDDGTELEIDFIRGICTSNLVYVYKILGDVVNISACVERTPYVTINNLDIISTSEYRITRLAEYWGVYCFMSDLEDVGYPLCYDFVEADCNGLRLVCLFEKYGFVDKSHKVIVPIIYDDADNFIDGYAQVELNNRRGKVDISGNIYWLD